MSLAKPRLAPTVFWTHGLRFPKGISHGVLTAVIAGGGCLLMQQYGAPHPLVLALWLGAVVALARWTRRALNELHWVRLSSHGLEVASRFGPWRVLRDAQTTITRRPAPPLPIWLCAGFAVIVLLCAVRLNVIRALIWIGLAQCALRDAQRGTLVAHVGEGPRALELDLSEFKHPERLAQDLAHAEWNYAQLDPDLVETR